MILAFVATVFSYTTDQASNGKDLYAKNCGVCQGASGGGGTVPKQFGDPAYSAHYIERSYP